MKSILIGIGEIEVDNAPGSVLKTFALGSCVGVVMLAPPPGARRMPAVRPQDASEDGPRWQAAGLAHVALPDSSINRELALQKPGYFADTAIPALIAKMAAYGCQHDDLVVKIAGGASIMDPENRFNIGGKNVLAIRKHLWRYGLGPVSEDVGDSITRTVTVVVDSGQVFVASPGKGVWEI
jgi:chemotaxis protein CheD